VSHHGRMTLVVRHQRRSRGLRRQCRFTPAGLTSLLGCMSAWRDSSSFARSASGSLSARFVQGRMTSTSRSPEQPPVSHHGRMALVVRHQRRSRGHRRQCRFIPAGLTSTSRRRLSRFIRRRLTSAHSRADDFDIKEPEQPPMSHHGRMTLVVRHQHRSRGHRRQCRFTPAGLTSTGRADLAVIVGSVG